MWGLLVLRYGILNLLHKWWIECNLLSLWKIEFAILPGDILFVQKINLNLIFAFSTFFHTFCFHLSGFVCFRRLFTLLHHHHHLVHRRLLAKAKSNLAKWTSLKFIDADTPLPPWDSHIGKGCQILRLNFIEFSSRWHLVWAGDFGWFGASFGMKLEFFAPSRSMW